MNNITHNSPNFGMMRISLDAEQKMAKLSSKEIRKIRRLGKYLNGCEEYDLIVNKNLEPSIRDNSKIFSTYVSPFKLSVEETNYYTSEKPNLAIKVSTTEVSSHPMEKGKQSAVDLYLNFSSADEAVGMYNRLIKSEDELEKTALLTKMLDVEKISQIDRLESESLPKGKYHLINDTLFKYGDAQV